MKRVLTAALVLLLALQGIAFSEGDALDVEIGAMYFSDSWNDVTSDTHTFLVVDASLVNWSTQEQILAEEIAAEISYKGSYVFPASLCFSHESIGQLVQLDGQFVFELPNMLAEVAPEELTLKIRVSGKETVVPLSVQSYVPSGNTGSYEGAGYATPEEAVQAYITARQAGDVSAMLSTFAIETYVDSYDAEAFLARIHAFPPTAYACVPVIDEYSRGVLISRRVAELSNAHYQQYLRYQWPSESYGEYAGATLPLTGEEEISAFINGLSDPEKAARQTDLEFLEFVSVDELDARLGTDFAKKYYSEGNQETIARQMAISNCEEWAEIIARVRFGGEEGYLFLQCARYGDRWYNFSCSSNAATLLGINPYDSGLVLEEALVADLSE